MKNFLTALLLTSTILFSQEQIPITINDYGLIFIKVKVNDEPGTFLLDTGGGAHVLSNNFFNKIKGETDESGFYTGFRHNGERIDTKVYTANSISVGSLNQIEPKIGMYPPLDKYGIDGILSLMIFKNTPFTIDFMNLQVILETDESLFELEKLSEIHPILFDSERDLVLDMFIKICLNDSVSLLAEFDTGAGFETFLLNKFYADKFNLPLDSLNNTNCKISLCGSETISNNKKSATVKDDLIYEGLIGSGLFKNSKLTIDIPNKRILVSK